MSFQSPLLLLGLLVLPLLLLAYLWASARRRRYAVRFPALDVLAEVAGREGRLARAARHLPAALLGLAALALALALARPQVMVREPISQASVMLVTDVSGSMEATDVAPNRLEAARAAAARFLDRVPGAAEVGLVSFAQSAQTLQPPTDRHDDVRAALSTLLAEGGTATGDALAVAVRDLRRVKPRPLAPGSPPRRPPSAIVLLSDGARTFGRDPIPVAREARRLGIPIYTVALGTPDGYVVVPNSGGVPQPVPPDPATMREVARITGARSYDAEDASALDGVYDELGRRLGTRRVPREVTAAFAGGGLLLLAGGLLAGLRRRSVL